MISPVNHGARKSPLSPRGEWFLSKYSHTGAWCRRNSPSSTFEKINDLELEELLELSLDNDIKCIAIKQALHKSPRSRGDTEQWKINPLPAHTSKRPNQRRNYFFVVDIWRDTINLLSNRAWLMLKRRRILQWESPKKNPLTAVCLQVIRGIRQMLGQV